MNVKQCLNVVLSALWGVSLVAAAEDIDLFQADSSVTGAPPNILFTLDDSANWNSTIGSYTKKQLVHEALYNIVTDSRWIGTETDPKMRVGLMHFAHSNSPKGGKVMRAVGPLTSTSSDAYKDMLYTNGVVEYGEELLEKTNNAPYALMINEAYRYFAGLSPMAGTRDGDHDPAAIGSDGNYISPAADNACGKSFLVLIGNGEPDSGEDGDAEANLRALDGVLPGDPISIDPSNFESNWSDEYARFLANTDVDAVREGDQGVITYVVDVHDPNSNQANTKKFKAARAWLKSIALRGDGRYFVADSAADIKDAVDEILEEIQAVNSVFASTTLPVSVNVRGTNLNQVYIGVFRPDGQKKPRWMGNLKLYQLAVDSDTDSVYLADVNGDRADSQATGFINSSAVSFWTDDSTFWSFSPRGTPESASDSPDGEVVEKGAAGQQLRDDYPSRSLYTCTGTCAAGSTLSATPFDTSNAAISQAALGAADADERSAVIKWIRGEDNLEDENADGSYTDVRSTVHGDVLHSRPAVINYNRDGSDDDIVVFYGANDGVFHAIEGGKNAADGHELWGFVPEEFFGKLKRLRDNTVIDETNGPKPYFADGSIGVYRKDANNDGALKDTDDDKVYIYLSMRRGGRIIYALDVSDPATPKLLWKRSHTDAGWGELGQTWSEPKVARVAYNGGTDVLIFGAGYDAAAEDEQPALTNTMGRGIMVVNAHTGELIWQVGPNPTGALHNVTEPAMVHSIPSTVTVIDRDRASDGYADRLYVGDTGGNVWRVDLASSDLTDWKVHRLASVGGTSADDGVRKFLYPPDVVYAEDGYDAVLIGSGDREHPFDETVTNRFYMFKDTATSAAIADSITTLTEPDLYDATDNLIQVGTDTERQTAQAELDKASGWYITLRTGEKVVGGAVTLSGTTFFNTNQPKPAATDSCVSNLGTARNYMVSFEDGSATQDNNGIAGLSSADRSRQVPGGGYPPSPVPVIVEIDGKKYQAVISGTQVAQAPGTQLETRTRSFWYKEVD